MLQRVKTIVTIYIQVNIGCGCTIENVSCAGPRTLKLVKIINENKQLSQYNVCFKNDTIS